MDNKRRTRNACIAAFLAAVMAVSSCKDISGADVVAHTAADPDTVSAAETTEAPEDDETLNIVTPGSAAVTTDEREGTRSPDDELPEITTAKTTTFPVQTTSYEELIVGGNDIQETIVSVTEPAATKKETASEPDADTTAAASVTPASTEYNAIGKNGILVSYQDGHYRGLMPCFGTLALCERWAKAVDGFADKLPDVKVYTMAVPIPSEFYTPQRYLDSGFTASQKKKGDHIRDSLKKATYVDAYKTLKKHIDEDIYLRTDHHWSPLGAYYAAGKFAEAAGVDFPDLDEYEPVSRKGYVGSMYTYSGDYHLYNDPEVFTMYLPPNVDKIKTTYYNTSFKGGYEGDLFVTRNASAYYCSFIGSDDRITRVKTNVKNGRTLVVFKQSYGNALIPFLTSGFETIYVCDMRYFNLNGVKFCKDFGATDLLFTDCVMIAAGNGCKYLEYLLG